ncbi:unnamed protein product [Symbiodinium sp. KB8]|nr:unnamed protein product [Symbiodinium sp. KB8]
MDLAVVPQFIAQANDSKRDTRFEVLTPKGKRRRLDTVALNAVAAKASAKLFEGKESHFVPSTESRLVTAARALQMAWSTLYHHVLPPWVLEEIDSECRQIIIDNHRWLRSFCTSDKLPCIFGNILEQLPETAAAAVSMEPDFTSKRRRVEGVTLCSHQRCFVHSEACPVGSAVHLDFSGLPCPDNSRANRKRKFQEGDSGIVYITWAKRHCQKQTPLLILENVLGLNMDAVRELLERDYFLHQLDVSPADAGAVPTYRCTGGKLWIPSLRRWLLPSEKMAAKARSVAAKATVPTAKAHVMPSAVTYPKAVPMPPKTGSLPARTPPPAPVGVAKAKGAAAPLPGAGAAKAKASATAAVAMFDPRSVPGGLAAAPAPPKLPPAPKPTGITWSDGFVVGDLPLGRPAAKTPAKGANVRPAPAAGRPVSAGGSRRRQVERYSQSYHCIAYLSDASLVEWLHHLAPDQLTQILLQNCTRELDKGECLAALTAEHQRLGLPLQTLNYTGQQALDHVRRIMAGDAGAPAADATAADAALALVAAGDGDDTAIAEAGQLTVVEDDEPSYTVAFINGDWILHQTINGEVSASVTLPPLQPSGGGFWQVIQTESGAVAWQGGEQEGLPCVDFFPAASGATGGSGGGAPPIEGLRLPDEALNLRKFRR